MKENIVNVIDKMIGKYTAPILLFLFHFILMLFMRFPIINDEFCFLSNAATLSGKFDWSAAYNTSINGYWGYGYSLLLVPFMFIFSSMQSIYFIGLLINTIFICLISLMCYDICLNYLNKSRIFSFGCSLATCLFPGISFYSKTLLSEITLVFVAWLVLYLFIKSYNHDYKSSKKFITYFILGCLSIYAYGVHGRGIVVLLSALVMIFLIKENKIYRLVSFGCGSGLFIIIDKILKGVLFNNLVLTSKENTFNTPSKIIETNLQQLKIENIIAFIKGAFSQGFYLNSVTLGLLCVFAVLFIFSIYSLIKKNKICAIEEKNYRFLVIYSGIIIILSIGISVLYFAFAFIQKDVIRREYIIYGRYIDTVVSLAVFCIYIFLASKEHKKKAYFWSMIGTFLGFSLISTYIAGNWMNIFNQKGLSYIMVEGIIPITGINYLSNSNIMSTIILSLTVAVLFFILFLSSLKKGQFIFVLLIIFSLYSTIYSMKNYLISSSNASFDSTEEACNLISKIHDKDVKIYLDSYSYRVLNLQAKFPDREFYNLELNIYGYGKLAEIEENSVILSSSNENFEYWLKNCYRIKQDEESGIYGWLYGDYLKNIVLKENEMLIELNKSNIFLDELELLSTTSGDSVFEDKLYLVPNERMYGPYKYAAAGNYKIVITGKNLNNTILSLSAALGEANYKLSNLITISNKITADFTLDVNVMDLEIILDNISDDLVIVDQILVSRLDDNYKGNYNQLMDSYKVINFSDARATEYFIKTDYSDVVGQTQIILKKDESFSLQNIYLKQGNYKIRMYGVGSESLAAYTVNSKNEKEELRVLDKIFIEKNNENSNSVLKYIEFEMAIDENTDFHSLLFTNKAEDVSRNTLIEIIYLGAEE